METLLPQSVSDTSPLLPKPRVVVQPTSSWAPLNLRDIWAYRELLYFLVWRDVKVRYKQTALGATWALLQPLLMMVIATLVFGRIAKLDQQTPVPYPLFAYTGLLLWTFFANTLNSSGNSLVTNANLITKVYFPRLIIPAATVAAGTVDLLVAFLLLPGLMLYYNVTPGLSILIAPIPILLTMMLALGVGMWLSALNVKYRDIRYILPFIVQLGIYVSPVFYPTDQIPERLRVVFLFNPMTGILDSFRAAILGTPLNAQALAISAIITIGVLIGAAFSFRRMEKSFADTI